jgi:hypothetical protein
MQVSDDGPLLGPTSLTIEDDGIARDRAIGTVKISLAAFQGVEIAKNAVILPVDNGIGLIIPASAFSMRQSAMNLPRFQGRSSCGDNPLECEKARDEFPAAGFSISRSRNTD